MQKSTAIPPPILQINLVQAISRADRMDWTIQKAVELGVNLLTPIYCERSIKVLDEKRINKKVQHWQGIVISACEQSDRSYLPTLASPATLKDFLQARDEQTISFTLDPEAKISLASVIHPCKKIDILIGPEGGLTDAEIAATEKAGFKSVLLGPRTLRTETAGIAALSIIQSQIGDLK